MIEKFAEDVREGLSTEPKFLQSKYFYDEKGDALFQKIMGLEEYYLTVSEYEIFNSRKQDILSKMAGDDDMFDLIEFGAGDGYKTSVLIDYFLDNDIKFKYVPIDISPNALKLLTDSLTERFPKLKVLPICDDYFHALEELNKVDFNRKIILFLGSNIGNFRGENAIPFLKHLKADMRPNDQLLIGFDLKKDPETILKAYNDPLGVTASFNLNLLDRINRELDADFTVENFRHYPVYDPVSGEARSYLVSMKDQEVYIGYLSQAFQFRKWEPIFMEVSQKYDVADIRRLAELSGFKVKYNFMDRKKYFTDSLWVLK